MRAEGDNWHATNVGDEIGVGVYHIERSSRKPEGFRRHTPANS